MVVAPARRATIDRLHTYWNWKSAALSAGSRAVIFLAANLDGGLAAATTAMSVEFVYRAVVSGWFGSLTERVGRHRSTSALLVLVVATAAAHVIEAFVHVRAGTPHVGMSVAGSVVFSVLSSVFNVFAMRRGRFVVGPGGDGLIADLRATPQLVRELAAALVVRRAAR